MALKIDREASFCDRHRGNKMNEVMATNTAAGDWETIRAESKDEFSSTYRQRGVQVEAMMIEKDQVPRMAFPNTTLSTNSWYLLPYRRPTVRSHAML